MIHHNLERDAVTVPNLVRSWSISTQIRYSCRHVEKWGTPNLLQLMLKKKIIIIITFIKPKGSKQYICFLLQYQILKVQKCINHDEYWYHVKQFILASACNFFVLVVHYVLYFLFWSSTLYSSCFPFVFIDRIWK